MATGNKQITVVYQDCPLCGDRGKAVREIVATNGVRLHKVSFASDEGRHLINIAVFQKGIKSMPFYTDGKKFTYEIKDLLEDEEEPEKEPAKPVKRAKKCKKAEKKEGLDDNGTVANA